MDRRRRPKRPRRQVQVRSLDNFIIQSLLNVSKRNTLGADLQISVNRRSSYSFVGVDYRAPHKPQLGLNYTWL
ncbi:hypothetical protein I7I48_07850 [Histoplasma ohiense]|nr:hypothetical protein I7I48_07850 [Histoplasma ohiense (nom. inval.)]